MNTPATPSSSNLPYSANSPSDFHATFTRRDAVVTLQLDGRFDFRAHPVFREVVRQALEQPGVRSIDLALAGVSYLDSAALGMLLMLRDRAQLPDGSVRLCQANESVQRVLDIARFERLFSIVRR